MRNILIAVLLLISISAKASDFSLTLKNPKVLAGQYSVSGMGISYGGALGLVSYKGVTPGTVGSGLINGWIPVTIGGTIGGSLGKASISIGTAFNLVPAFGATILELSQALSPDSEFTAVLSQGSSEKSDWTFFFGPQESLIAKSTKKIGTKVSWFLGVIVK